MRKIFLLSLAVLLTSCAPSANKQAADSSQSSNRSENSVAVSYTDRLIRSPRHQEWVDIQSGDKSVYAWVVYPETSEPAPVILLIHENRGLNDWARSMADRFAEEGYIAVAPDLLSGFSDTERRTSDFPDEDAAVQAISQLEQDDVISDLQAVANWATTIPSSSKKLVSVGFCWGGGQSFRFASERDDLAMALVFYGTGPAEESAYKTVSAPVFGFYGGADQRVNATIEGSKQYMETAGKQFEYVIYEGAGHAFMRHGEDPNGDPANVVARNEAWQRTKEILSTLQ